MKALLTERHHYSLISEISDRLDQLHKDGGAKLFWGDEYDESRASQITQRVRDQVTEFDSRVAELQKRYDDGEGSIHSLSARVNVLNEKSFELEEYADEIRHQFVIEREMEELPFRPMVMPWSDQEDDKQRFRRVLVATLVVALLLGLLIPLWDI